MISLISGHNREKVTRGWKRLHNEELHNLFPSPNIIRMMKMDEMGRAYSTHGKDEKFT